MSANHLSKVVFEFLKFRGDIEASSYVNLAIYPLGLLVNCSKRFDPILPWIFNAVFGLLLLIDLFPFFFRFFFFFN